MKNNFSINADKTKCPGPEEMMDFMGGGLERAEADAFKKHLESCSTCRILVDDLKATLSELKSLTVDEEVREDLVEKIMQGVAGANSVAGHAESSNSLHVFLRLAAGFIILSVAVLGFGLLWKNSVSDSGIAMKPGSGESVVPDKVVAVRNTLKWLASVQQPSGGWDAVSWGGKSEYSLALNGLALLTFARSGGMMGENIPVIDRSVKYLLGRQAESGLFGVESEGMMYNHGIVSVALLEAYAVTRDQMLKPPISKALAFIRGQQLNTGGWGYVNRPGEFANTPVTLWQLQALILSAKLGWDDRDYSLKRGLRWFSSMIDDGGQLGYERPSHFPEGSATLTAMGAFCMFSASDVWKLSDTGVLLRLQQALNSLKHEEAQADYYGSYFRAAALQSVGKNEQPDGRLVHLQHSLIAMQEHSGGNAGSWSPGDRWGAVGGRIYSTSVAGLTLELASRTFCPAVSF